jgi:hypothetical protein
LRANQCHSSLKEVPVVSKTETQGCPPLIPQSSAVAHIRGALLTGDDVRVVDERLGLRARRGLEVKHTHNWEKFIQWRKWESCQGNQWISSIRR